MPKATRTLIAGEAHGEILELDDPLSFWGGFESETGTIIDQAHQRWPLADAFVLHRYGRMHADEAIMMVATAARHRKDAFEAAEFLMDYLKSRAPFWKKEHSAQSAAWVAAREEDETALNRWSR